MSKFLTELDCKLKGDKIWVLTEPLIYQSDLLWAAYRTDYVFVPPGFETDLASVPRVPVAYWFWGGRAHREGVLHDYLYRKDSIPVVSLSTANEVFLEAMESRGKSWGVRYPMYWGVCVGGAPCYHKKMVADKL